MSTQLQFRRGNTAQTATFTGAVAEITVDTDKKVVVVHDGVTAGGWPAPTLSYVQAAFDAANAEFANLASELSSNVEFIAAINASQNTNISAVANLAQSAYNTANLKFDSAGGTISGNVVVTGNVTPTTDNVYTLGTSSLKWKSIYVGNGSVYIDNTVLSTNNGSLIISGANDIILPNSTAPSTTQLSNTSNAAFIQANSAFDAQNTTGSYANSAFAKANSAGNYANGAFEQANAAYNSQNTTGSYANSAYAEANTAYSAASNAYNFATSVNVYATGAFTQANSAFDAANSAGSYANAAFAAANNVAPQIQPTFNQANAAFDKANAAYESQNTTGAYANAAFGVANSAASYANGAFVQANAAFNAQNTTGSYANSAFAVANSAGSYANGAFGQANAAFNKANTSVQTSGINSITSGSLTITNTGGIGLTVTGNAVFNNDITVAGNVFIGGNATSFGANNITVEDSMIFLANNNNQDLVDIGFVAHFDSGTGLQHTGLVRDASDDTWKFFSNVFPNPTTTVDFTNAVYDPVRMGALTASSATINGVDLLSYAQAAYAEANGAVQTGFTTISANGSSITPSSNADTLTITAATANGINVLNPSSKTIDLGLRTSGVTSGTYGGSTNIPVLVVDGFGRVTSAANVAVSTTINLAGGSGSGSVSGGGTLTISGGTGITTSVSGSTITVTNSGVTSFNGATGVITFGSANVTNALGYTPANRAGDAFTGAISSSGSITGSSLTSNTSITVNTNGNITSNTFTTAASVTQVNVDSFSTSTFRSAKYEVQMTAGTSYHVIELRVVHDGTTVWLAQYGEIFTGSSLGTFDASIATGVLNLQFTPASATATTVRVIRTAIAV